MKQALDEAFARYGLAAEICRGEEKEAVKAFIQPMMRETGEEPFDATPLGAADGHIWRYLGPADAEIGMGDYVLCREKRYIVRDTAAVLAGAAAIYRWAVLKEETA